MDYELFIRVQ